jgi:hypothetical protein
MCCLRKDHEHVSMYDMTVFCFSFKIHLTQNSVRLDTFLKHRGSVSYVTFNIIPYYKALDKKHLQECLAADIWTKGCRELNKKLVLKLSLWDVIKERVGVEANP